MADQQPDPNPAATGPAASGPQQPGASGAAGDQAAQQISFDSFSDEDKKYLAGQGITKQEELTQESLIKVFGHARSSQKTAQERQAEIDRIKASINPQGATGPDPNPFGQPQNPGTTPTDGATPSSAPSNPEQQGLDPVTAFNLATSLGGRFPELAPKLADGSFYDDMKAMGIPVTVNGQVNLNGIMSYGTQAQKLAQYEAKIAEADKNADDKIPPANPENPGVPKVADDAPMTRQIALAILYQDPNHSRAAEAKQFFQK